MNCPKCRCAMSEGTGTTPEGVEYKFFRCGKCREELVHMKQLQDVARKYREMKEYRAKVSKWGESLAVRIPRELVERYSLRQNSEVGLIPEKNSIKIVA